MLSDADVVARGVAERWGTPATTGFRIDGAPVRALADDLWVVRRPGPHLHDERLDLRLPSALADRRPTFVFPSIHRSQSGERCFTVHPLGNPGERAELGGRPRTVVPTDPRGMAAVLRALEEGAGALGVSATYEATHHGPELASPAMFVEVAVAAGSEPSDAEIGVLAQALRAARPDRADHVALAVGGGHYAPRFTDLARSRHWAFGHIFCRHALADLAPETARAGLEATPGALGILFARAEDRALPAFTGLAKAVRETDAPKRVGRASGATSKSPQTSGT